jgi:predicted enzyme related to lactoylglutathione lyase
MSPSRFVRYHLRTLDVEAAKDFYTKVLGEIWGTELEAYRLHDLAIASGARPHWLGNLGVGSDFETSTDRLVALGAERLGPTVRGASYSWAPLRDPFGAILALSSETAPPVHDVVALHVLHTRDHEKAFSTYSSLFGWTPTELVDRGDEGHYQGFTWSTDGSPAGIVSDAARSPSIHPQWLYFFRVSNLEEKLALVRKLGGTPLDPVRTSRGDLIAPCDDPQGAAFGLFEAAPGRR